MPKVTLEVSSRYKTRTLVLAWESLKLFRYSRMLLKNNRGNRKGSRSDRISRGISLKGPSSDIFFKLFLLKEYINRGVAWENQLSQPDIHFCPSQDSGSGTVGRVVGFLATVGSMGKVLLPPHLSLPNLDFTFPQFSSF